MWRRSERLRFPDPEVAPLLGPGHVRSLSLAGRAPGGMLPYRLEHLRGHEVELAWFDGIDGVHRNIAAEQRAPVHVRHPMRCNLLAEDDDFGATRHLTGIYLYQY